MELFLLYLWLKLNTFHEMLEGILPVMGLVSFILAFIYLPGCPWDGEKSRKWFRNSLVIFSFALFAKLILPTQTQVAVLVGAKVAMDMATSPEGTKVATILRGKANEFLDSEISKLKQGAK